MKRNIILLFACILFAAGCVKEQFPMSVLGEGEGWLYMKFGATDNVEITTKSTLDYGSENQILNIYVFIFDSSGNKVYGNWLQSADRLADEAAVQSSTADKSWYVANSSTEGTPSRGCLKVKAPIGSDLKVYLITNLNADMVKISSDLLASSVNNESDLKNFRLQLNQFTVNRNAYFPMCGVQEHINIAGTDADMNGKYDLKLKRLDAKIKFKFVTGSRVDENGQVIKQDTDKELGFKAIQWKVVNVPVTSFVVEQDDDSYMAGPHIATEAEYAAAAPYFFDTEWVNYEESEKSGDMSFSFYMMENRQSPKNSSFSSYNDRSREVKTPAGLNSKVHVEYVDKRGRDVTKDVKQFVNANDFSTYVLVEGRVDMQLDDDDKGKVLGADVTYLIHLGNWNATISNDDGKHYTDDVYSDIDNFKTERNHSYTYTVTVNSVNNIRVEVESSDNEGGSVENQPGATGLVTIAKEEIALCDAHYVSKTMTFHAKNFYTEGGGGHLTCTADQLTWKVKTPFCDGSPRIENGEDVPEGLDYQWVHFRLNKRDPNDGTYYSDQRRKYTQRVFASSETYRDAEKQNAEDDGTPGLAGYHNDGAMNIIDLVKYIKKQANLYVDKQNGIDVKESDFDSGAGDPEGPKISVTVFVDEYYYDAHPLTGVKSADLWKDFVNKPDRSMHILCDSNTSTDLESYSTGSVISIQQHSIQTIFNDDKAETALTTAWGLEHKDEFPDMWEWGDNSSAGNSDLFNGLLNTCKLWGLCNASSTTFNTGLKWSNYMAIEVNNDTPQMIADGTHNKLRYSCMTRNRDNNGNGVIDRDEIRWYTASIRQLIGIYVGEGVITPTSRLYNRSPEWKNSDDKTHWMQHVVSSSYNGGETLVWAEEGIATGPYGTDNQEGANIQMSVRCIRNLGMDADHPLSDLPQDYVQKELNSETGGTVYNMSFVNKGSLRDYTSIELPLHLENSKENYLYEQFETATEFVDGISSYKFQEFNELVTNTIAAGGSNPFCPKGYRTPNQREVAIMAYNKLYDGSEFNYYNGSSKGNIMSRTAFSFGYYGNKKVDKYGFMYTSLITLSAGESASTTRCVRDVRVD